eukprot:1659262-Prymnesium_polylepis.1
MEVGSSAGLARRRASRLAGGARRAASSTMRKAAHGGRLRFALSGSSRPLRCSARRTSAAWPFSAIECARLSALTRRASSASRARSALRR